MRKASNSPVVLNNDDRVVISMSSALSPVTIASIKYFSGISILRAFNIFNF